MVIHRQGRSGLTPHVEPLTSGSQHGLIRVGKPTADTNVWPLRDSEAENRMLLQRGRRIERACVKTALRRLLGFLQYEAVASAVRGDARVSMGRRSTDAQY